MKATPLEQKELLRLQALDIKLRQLTHQARSLAEHAVLVTLGTSLDAAKTVVATRSGERDDVRTELHRIESDVDVVEKRIARDEDRLQHTSSVKDVQALESELTALRKRLVDLEEIEIAVMERLEDQDSRVAAAAADRDALTVQIRETEEARDLSLVDVNRQHTDLVSDRAAVASAIPAALSELYEKRAVTGHGNAAALLRARTCSGCTMTLTGNDLADVRQAPADDVLFCPDCSAILVRTEESGI